MTKGTNFIIAAAAGFVAGILLAPKSGQETRQELKKKVHDNKKKAADKAGHWKETMSTGAKEASEEATELARSAKESARRMAAEAKGLGREAKTRANNVAERTRGTDNDELPTVDRK